MKTGGRKYVEYAPEEWRQSARHYCDVNGRLQWREQGAYDVSTTLSYVRVVGTERRSEEVAGHADVWTLVPIHNRKSLHRPKVEKGVSDE